MHRKKTARVGASVAPGARPITVAVQQNALMSLGKHLGMFTDRYVIEGSINHRISMPRPEAVAEAYKVGLVDGIQHFGYRALDNLVFERGYAERPTAAVAFRDVGAADRLWPVLPTGPALVDAAG